MFGSVIIFILVLSLLILVHELGHFLAARKAGILVEEFGFGLPPRVFGKKVGETIYSINLLPFGGFVRLHGENYEEDIINPKRAFLNSKLSTRTIIITAGVVMNFLLAIVAFAIVYSFTGVPRQTNEVMILEVSKDTSCVFLTFEYVSPKLIPLDIIFLYLFRPVNFKSISN